MRASLGVKRRRDLSRFCGVVTCGVVDNLLRRGECSAGLAFVFGCLRCFGT